MGSWSAGVDRISASALIASQHLKRFAPGLSPDAALRQRGLIGGPQHSLIESVGLDGLVHLLRIATGEQTSGASRGMVAAHPREGSPPELGAWQRIGRGLQPCRWMPVGGPERALRDGDRDRD